MRQPSHTEGTAWLLAGALARAAADPGNARHLHETFGSFCHQFRNGLHALRMTLYLAEKAGRREEQDLWSGVEARYAVLERFIDRFHQVCRPLPLSPVRLPLDALFDDRRAAWSEVLAGFGRRLVVIPPAVPASGAFDPLQLGQGLDDLVAWRAGVGDPGTSLRVRWSVDGGAFRVTWDEPADLEPRHPPPTGGPGSAVRPSSDDDGLAALTLPYLATIMASHGGTAYATEKGPWRLTLRWPLDAPPTPRETPPCLASRRPP
jgi:hypothetical protein